LKRSDVWPPKDEDVDLALARNRSRKRIEREDKAIELAQAADIPVRRFVGQNYDMIEVWIHQASDRR
jgi:hypothetical protein